jgi:hypothetical protein
MHLPSDHQHKGRVTLTMTDRPDHSHFTESGLRGIDRVPYGMHACHFYSNRDELIAALIPYIATGLRSNERCLWIAAPPLPAREAVRALRAAWDGCDEALETGALRIRDFDQWYASSSRLKGLDVVQLWLEEEQRALAEGYSGLRITRNTSFLQPSDWPTFMEYERAVTSCLNGRRIVALCSYGHPEASGQQMSDVMEAHHCALGCSDAEWQVVAVPKILNGMPGRAMTSSI